MDPDVTRSPFERPLVRGAIAAVLLVAALGAVFAVRASGGGSDNGAPVSVEGAPTRSGSPAADTGRGALDNRSPIVGQAAPDFELRDLNGDEVQLSDLRGKVVWVNFWASWCKPCRQELPDIQKLYDEKRDEGLVVLAVNWQDNQETARDYAERLGLSLPVLLDGGGSVYDQYKLQGLPDSFFIDRDGNVATLQFGSLNESKMRERLAKAGLP
ncbi:MAG TPA: TlpA disulfide reductase family protein [Dehalococcoidia bacterium]